MQSEFTSASSGAATSTRVPPKARVIDGRGMTLSPGLWDCHMHVGDDFTGLQELSLGVTSMVAGYVLSDLLASVAPADGTPTGRLGREANWVRPELVVRAEFADAGLGEVFARWQSLGSPIETVGAILRPPPSSIVKLQ